MIKFNSRLTQAIKDAYANAPRYHFTSSSRSLAVLTAIEVRKAEMAGRYNPELLKASVSRLPLPGSPILD